MHRAHEPFDRKLTYKPDTVQKDALSYADTGAQTCSSGTEILELLNCPEDYLIPTSHRIRGIKKSSLDIKEVLLLLIQVRIWKFFGILPLGVRSS